MPRNTVSNSTVGCLVLAFHLGVCYLGLFAQGPIPNWSEFHKKDLHNWAARTGLSFQFLNELTNTATHDDDPEAREEDVQYVIENVDAKTLSAQKHILLATWDPGTGHCLTLYVLKKEAAGFQKIWQNDYNFCTESVLGPARTRAMPDGRIIVRYRDYSTNYTPEKSDAPVLRVDVAFRWDGTTYISAGRRQRPDKLPR